MYMTNDLSFAFYTERWSFLYRHIMYMRQILECPNLGWDYRKKWSH